MQGEGGKNWKYWVAAGVGAFVAGAAIYACFSGGEDENSMSDEDLIKELQAANLDKVQSEKNGQIGNEYFLRLLQYIGSTVREQQKDDRYRMICERRALYNKDVEDDPDYTEKVREIIMTEENAVNKFLKRVIDQVGISQAQFEDTHQKLASHPQTAEYVMAAQQGKLEKNKPLTKPSLAKKVVLEYLKKSQRQAAETMSKMQKSKDMQNQNADPMDMMVKMMTQQARMQDDLYFDTDIEHDEFEENLMHFMTNDKDVAMKMQEYMMAMRAQMGGQH